MFSFLLRRRASPPRPRTNAEKRLGTEDYSLKGKAKAFLNYTNEYQEYDTIFIP